jgi:hypothetical protein
VVLNLALNFVNCDCFFGKNYFRKRILENICTRTGTTVTHLVEAVALMIEKRSLNVKCLDLLIRELCTLHVQL